MEERIQKILSSNGICSRRSAEMMIQEGRVTVNGVCAELGQKADPVQDQIAVDGCPLQKQNDKIYLALHKPRGYVSTMSDEKGRKTVSDLVADLGVRVYPVGRLDMDSSGLLLMTNDGELANKLMHPSFEKSKTYFVRAVGNPDHVEDLRIPMKLDGYLLATPEIQVHRKNGTSADFEITIHEGRNRQIRRMCEKVGLEVRLLKRISEAGISLGDLPEGKWRLLTEEEVTHLRR